MVGALQFRTKLGCSWEEKEQVRTLNRNVLGLRIHILRGGGAYRSAPKGLECWFANLCTAFHTALLFVFPLDFLTHL